MKKYKVEEVNAGICTCTLRGKAIESVIASHASQGWIFEQMEPVIGRCCVFFQRYKMIIVFSKES